MPQASLAAPPAKRPVTYAALGLFWALILGLCVGVGVMLQMLGPINTQPASPGHKPTQAEAAAPARPALPAEPANKLVAIAAPTDALLEELTSTDDPGLAGAKLPKVAQDGKDWPAKHYAAAVSPPDGHPRVVLVVSGAGLDEDLTLKLLRELPAAVDIVFSAYMPPDRAGGMAQAARETGHECLLSIPMEPSNAPMHEEGDHELTAEHTDDDNQHNLYWSLSRLGGCIGATGAADNGMRGDRFAQSNGFTNMLVEITKRGLMYLDPLTRTPVLYPAGTNPPELPDAQGNIDLVRKTTILLDEPGQNGEPPGEAQIRNNLDKLVALATLAQPAIGLAVNLNPQLISILQDWAKTLPARGITLVPLSATPTMPPPSPLDVIPPPDQK